jgi:hypothetical protein
MGLRTLFTTNKGDNNFSNNEHGDYHQYDGQRHGRAIQAQTKMTKKSYGASGQQAQIHAMPKLGRKPQQIVCPFCNAQGRTQTKRVMSKVGLGTSAVCCLVFWPLFWVPLVAGSCQTVIHYCSRCNREVGDSRPLD